ncbi:MAG TPA: 3-oxoacyl-[acyl-carrier-protein] reductase [Myxococcota bacterium]|nr:3-oxoacyl-[acyl-carrier-protein] reductase [Myxococcota bacterium]
MSDSLAGKVALVTGGSRGIGRAIAIELARAGAQVVFTYVANPEAARETEKAIAEAGGSGKAVRCDVADHEAVEALVAGILQEHKRIDVAVNNAGIARDQLILRMKPEDFDAVIATNLRGAWSVCRAVAKPMLKQRFGRIINLSSVVAGMGNPGQSNYAASKGGLEALTRSLAREIGSRNVTVNAVAPGFIDTDMTKDLPEQAKAVLVERIPLGRLGTGEDVAGAVRFLASDAASYVTGQVIHVNGGLD